MYFRKIIKSNKIFFFSFGFYLLFGSILLGINEIGDAIKFFGNYRNPIVDNFFKNYTKVGEEWPYVLAVAILLFVRFKDAFLVPLIGGVVTLISFLLKLIFSHPRPINYYRELGQTDSIQFVDGIHVVTGLTSFPSGHTMSAFALFGFLAFSLKNKNFLGSTLFLTAFLVAVSRVYLVHHFLKDIVFGAFLGVLIAMFFHWLAEEYIWRKPEHVMNRSLLNRKEGVPQV